MMKKWILFVVVITISTVSVAQTNETLARSYFMKAQEEYNGGHNLQALQSLAKCAKYLGDKSMKSPRFVALYARVLIGTKSYISAESWIETYLKIANRDDPDYNAMSNLAVDVKTKVEKQKKDQEKLLAEYKQSKAELDRMRNKDAEEQAYQDALNSGQKSLIEDFITNYPNSEHLDEAKEILYYFDVQSLTIINQSKFNNFVDKTAYYHNLSSLNVSHIEELFFSQVSTNRLTKLKHLTLTYDDLLSVPDKIGLLKNLQTLDLSHNDLSSLPNSMANLNNLTSLDLSYNPSISIDNIGVLHNLKILNLSHDRIQSKLSSLLVSVPKSLQNIAGLVVIVSPHDRELKKKLLKMGIKVKVEN